MHIEYLVPVIHVSEGIPSKHFLCSEEGFQGQTVPSLFTANAPCQLPSVNFDISLLPTITQK